MTKAHRELFTKAGKTLYTSKDYRNINSSVNFRKNNCNPHEVHHSSEPSSFIVDWQLPVLERLEVKPSRMSGRPDYLDSFTEIYNTDYFN